MYIEICTIPAFDTHWWRLMGRNKRVIATSETYDSKSNCRRAARSVAKRLGLKVKE